MTPTSKNPSIEIRMCAVGEEVLYYAFAYAMQSQVTSQHVEIAETIKMNISNIRREICAMMLNEINRKWSVNSLANQNVWLNVRELLIKKVDGKNGR